MIKRSFLIAARGGSASDDEFASNNVSFLDQNQLLGLHQDSEGSFSDEREFCGDVSNLPAGNDDKSLLFRKSLPSLAQLTIEQRLDGRGGSIRRPTTSRLGGNSFRSYSTSFTTSEKVISPRHPSSAKLDSEHDRKIREVRMRAYAARVADVKQREQLKHDSQARLEMALARRSFLGERSQLERVASWIQVVHLCAATSNFLRKLKEHNCARRPARFFPLIAVRLRSLLRKIRVRKAILVTPRPSIATLRTDKILNLFSDGHLKFAAENLKLRYHFEGEMIVFMGSEDDEGFVLGSGKADVMMGTTKVFTLRPGMCFGIVGMVSGEPRSASIRACEPCLVWAISNATFKMYNAGTLDTQIAAAHEAIAELRQSNLSSVYKHHLEPHALSNFPLLKGCPHEILQIITSTNCLPRVVKAQTVMFHPKMPLHQQPQVILLRGSVRVFVNSSTSPSSHFTIRESLRLLFELPAGRPHPSITADLQTGNDAACLEFSAPALINLAAVFLGLTTPLPFTVETSSDCDLLQLSRETIRHLDVLDLAGLRQTSQNLCCDFFPAVDKTRLVKHLFSNLTLPPSITGAVGTLVSGSMQVNTEKWIYLPGDFLVFDPQSHFLIHVIISGEIDVFATPLSWPPLPLCFFATNNMTVRAKSRVETLRITRRDLLSWIAAEFRDESVLAPLAWMLAQSYSLTTGRIPTFSQFDLGDTDTSSMRCSRRRSIRQSNLGTSDSLQILLNCAVSVINQMHSAKDPPPPVAARVVSPKRPQSSESPKNKRSDVERHSMRRRPTHGPTLHTTRQKFAAAPSTAKILSPGDSRRRKESPDSVIDDDRIKQLLNVLRPTSSSSTSTEEGVLYLPKFHQVSMVSLRRTKTN